ncbi:MAG TPA: response regulator transcription factor [Dokdonella sp.]|uniref:response regulator transcription factor n=1 Tax=Dokdonella sp. TaxID=2291710 RepID=UPI002D80B5B1|nr:response regulator transcription factor [Dokdonella sp.]HET9033170.1 response regulator transcription factor [Dokdonella sp.]
MSKALPRLLIVEDDPTIAGNLFAFFESRGFSVDAAYDGHNALHRLTVDAFEAVILDVGLPSVDGLTVLHRMRNELGLDVPVLLLTARDEIGDKLAGFARGADDYVTKPFVLVEVEARVRALIARASGRVSAPLKRCGPLSLDPRRHELQVDGVAVKLTPKGWSILDVLMRDPGRVVPRGELERALWGDDPPETDALRSQVHLLRKALAEAGFDGIETIHGIGFRLIVAADSQ